MPTTVPILCVRSLPKTSRLLCELLDWRSTHGGEEFDELVDADNERVLWLHRLDAPEHPRFKDNTLGGLGRGFAIYVFVKDINQVRERADGQKVVIVEEVALNPNAGFREFTFAEENGYMFSVAEFPKWSS